MIMFLYQIKNMLIFGIPIGIGIGTGMITTAYLQSWWGWLAAPAAWYISGTILFYVLNFLFGLLLMLLGWSLPDEH